MPSSAGSAPLQRARHAARIALALLLTLLPILACGGGSPDAHQGDAAESAAETEDRPPARTDTIRIEGMPEPIALRLFRSPDDFPLPFSAYVPRDMAGESVEEAEEGSAGVRFVAEFGGQRNEDAFVHVYVFPDRTTRETAVAHARAYQTSRGIPASQGVELLPEPPPPELAWAVEAYRFRYQVTDGAWLAGSIGVGQHDDRYFMIVRHYPIEYAEGFGPRADLILETWQWSDGGRLEQAELSHAEARVRLSARMDPATDDRT